MSIRAAATRGTFMDAFLTLGYYILFKTLLINISASTTQLFQKSFFKTIGVTIEPYIILQKKEKVKKMLSVWAIIPAVGRLLLISY
jgi:hypothetical protein